MFVSLPSLQFGVYDVVSNFKTEMKASVLTCEKLAFDPGFLHFKRRQEIYCQAYITWEFTNYTKE